MGEYVVFPPAIEAEINDMCRREALIEYFKRYSGVKDTNLITYFENLVWDLPEETAFDLYMSCHKRYGGIIL